MGKIDEKEIGNRCRKYRMANGWSLQTLAEKMNTSAQNISKLEREGISKIDDAMRLSEIFGQDLLKNERDEEGAVGEIGKEILRKLVVNAGIIQYKDLKKNLYGLSDEIIAHEITKLQGLGLSVREQYYDYHSKMIDSLFITAKGIIMIKNLPSVCGINNDDLSNVKSYEQLVKEYDCYQDSLDSNEYEKEYTKLCDLTMFEPVPYGSNYQVNLVKYLKVMHDNKWHELHEKSYIPCGGIYHDVLYRMALGLDNDRVLKLLQGDAYFNKMNIIDQYMDRFIVTDENVILDATHQFKQELSDFIEDDDLREEIDFEKLSQDVNSLLDNRIEAYKNTLKKAKEIYYSYNLKIIDDDTLVENIINSENGGEIVPKKIGMDLELLVMDIDFLSEVKTAIETLDEPIEVYDEEETYNKNRPEGGSYIPYDWFSSDEIKKFIEENYLPPVECDEPIRKCLVKLKEIDSTWFDLYYEFPEEWEKNGIAELIRERSGLY